MHCIHNWIWHYKKKITQPWTALDDVTFISLSWKTLEKTSLASYVHGCATPPETPQTIPIDFLWFKNPTNSII